MGRIKEFDAIVLGGGSGGCIMVNRLINAGKKVLLLEAGPHHKTPLERRSEYTNSTLDEETQWDFHYVSEEETTGYVDGGGDPLKVRPIDQSMGKLVGGSGHHFGMMVVRGTREDSDEWDYLFLDGSGVLTGTVTWNGTTTVTGSGTAFDTELKVGDYIQLDIGTPGGPPLKIAAIASATSLTLENPQALTIPSGSAPTTKNTFFNSTEVTEAYKRVENDIDFGISKPTVHGAGPGQEIGRQGGAALGDTRTGVVVPRIDPSVQAAADALLGSTADPKLPLTFTDDRNDPDQQTSDGLSKNPRTHVGFSKINSPGAAVAGGNQYNLGHYNKYDERRSGLIVEIDPIVNDKDLTIIDEATVVRVLIEDMGQGLEAFGVEYIRTKGPHDTGKLQQAFSPNIIMCAGPYGTPAILLRSGIGAVDRLAPHGIPVIHNLPGVGKNMINHPTLAGVWSLNDDVPQIYDSLLYVARVRTSQVRPIGEIGVGSPAKKFDTDYDVEFLFIPSAPNDVGLAKTSFSTIGLTGKQAVKNFSKRIFVGISLLWKARSRGDGVRLRSASPFDLPEIRMGIFGNAAVKDAEAVLEGLDIMAAAFNDGTQPFQPLTSAAFPRPTTIEEVHASVGVSFHAVGTCAMGPASDPDAVLDERAQMRGVKGIWCADNSIYPTHVRGNPHLPTTAYADIVSNLVLADGRF